LEKERTMIFVDHANVFKNLEIADGRINWKKFKKKLAGNLHLVGAFAYIGVPNPIPKNQRKFRMLYDQMCSLDTIRLILY